jgi:hypothetical protein
LSKSLGHHSINRSKGQTVDPHFCSSLI